MRISDWSSDVCSSDLVIRFVQPDLRDYLGRRGHSAGEPIGARLHSVGFDAEPDRADVGAVPYGFGCIGGRDVHFVSVGQPSRVFDGARLVALAGRGVKGPALRFAARYEPEGAAGQAGGGGPRPAVYAVWFSDLGFNSRWMAAGGASRLGVSAG